MGSLGVAGRVWSEREWEGVVDLPLVAVAGILFTPFAPLVLLVWPAQVLRLRGRGESWAGAFFLVVGKLAEAQGVVGYHLARLKGAGTRIIEYK